MRSALLSTRSSSMSSSVRGARRGVGSSLLALVALAGVAAAPATATAQERAGGVLEGEPSIRQKQLYLEGRHLLLPTFGVTINDAYRRNLLGGVSYRYFASHWLGLGLDLLAGTAVDTGLTENIENDLSTDDTAFDVQATSLRFLASAVAELVPLEGKLMMLGAQMRADFHITLGFGLASIAGEGRIEDTLSIMPSIGVGMRFFPEPWISVGLDVKDLIINRVLAAGFDGSVPDKGFHNNWLVALSVGFALPPETEVRP